MKSYWLEVGEKPVTRAELGFSNSTHPGSDRLSLPQRIKTFTSRHFELTKDCLTYYDKKGGKIKGGILIETIVEVRPATGGDDGFSFLAQSVKHKSSSANSFYVVTNADPKGRGSNRNYLIFGDSVEERDAWVAAISAVVKKDHTALDEVPYLCPCCFGRDIYLVAPYRCLHHVGASSDT